MKGKIIIIEGTDASGKSTQLKALCEYLTAAGKDYKTVTFPRYSEDSSVLVRMYLNGEFGSNAGDVNAYAASTFFAVDRFASYKTDWKEYYENGGILIFDRYTTSNAIHQAAKLPEGEREAFFNWLFDFEYNLLTLPAPDFVFFLDMPPEYAARLLRDREGKVIDIHEKDDDFRRQSYNSACLASQLFGWQRISCVADGNIKSIEEIHREIVSGIEECF